MDMQQQQSQEDEKEVQQRQDQLRQQQKNALLLDDQPLESPVAGFANRYADGTVLEIVEEDSWPSILELIEDGDLSQAHSLLRHNSDYDPEDFGKTWGGRIGEPIEPNDPAAHVLRVLQGYRPDDDRVVADVLMPIFELHCPHLSDCKTTAKIAFGSEKTWNLSMTILGVQLGGGKRVRSKVSEVVRYATGKCYSYLLPMLFTLRRWRSVDNKYVKPIYVLESAIPKFSTPNFLIPDESVGHPHYCRETATEFKRFETNDWAQHLFGGGSVDVAEKVEGSEIDVKSTGLRFEMPLNYEGYGLNLAVETSVKNEFSLKHELAGNASYSAFTPAIGDRPVYWNWKLKKDDVF